MPRNVTSANELRIATTTTLKAPVQQVEQFVAYHHQIGVDEIFLFFDDPTDPALPAVADLPGVTAIACDEAHWTAIGRKGQRPTKVQGRQIRNANWLIETLPNRFDWLIHIDSDELIWAPRGLHRTLAHEGADAGASIVQLSTLEAVPDPEQTDPFLQTELFKAHRPKRYGMARRLGARTGFNGTRKLLRGHNVGKPAIALDGVVRKVRIHNAKRVKKSQFKRVVSRQMYVLHFDAGSFEDWKTKWRDRAGFARGLHSRARQRQWDEFARLDAAGDEDGLRALYARNYLIPAREVPVLRALGLVKKIRLEPSLFTWPGQTPSGALKP